MRFDVMDPPDRITHSIEPYTEELVERAQAGDQEAGELLAKRVLPRVSRWVRRGLSTAARRLGETRDLVQDVLLNAHRRLFLFENRGRRSYSAFLYQATENRLKNLRRRSTRVEAVEVSRDDSARHPEAATADPAERRLVAMDEFWKAFRSARPADQAALCAWLKHVQEGSAPAIWQSVALDLGKSTPDAARVAVRRAAERILRRLS